jgi:CrcB protein
MARRSGFSLVNLCLVIVGGALGVALRAALVLPLEGVDNELLVPTVTLVVNLVGSFVLGYLIGRVDGGRPHLRAFAGTGILGGFTTYSAFAVQVIQVTSAAPVVGLLLAAVAAIGGVAAAIAGLEAGRRAAGRPDELDSPEVAE